MALSVNTVWEVRTGGSNTNGGGYVSGGTDWSQQNSPQYSVTDAVTNGTTTITSATANFGTDVVGNILYISGGSASIVAGWYQIISRTNSTTIVVDRSTGLTAGTGATLNIGGALLTLAQVASIATSTNVCWIRSGTYDTGSQIDTNANWSSYKIYGYGTTRGDGTRATLRATAAITMILARNNGEGCIFRNLNFDGNSDTGTNGLQFTNHGSNSSILLDNCRVFDWSGSGMLSNTTNLMNLFLLNTEFFGCAVGLGGSTDASSMIIYAVGCIFRNNSSHGTQRVGGFFDRCIGYANGGNGFENGQNTSASYNNCIAYGNTADGFGSGVGNTRRSIYTNCISYGNSSHGFDQTTSDAALAYNCATGSNSSGAFNNVTQVANNILLTVDPFTDAANGNFSLNNTAGGGALCRAAGFPGSFVSGLTTGYLDVGAVQHQDSGSSGASVLIGKRIHIG